MAKYEAIVIGGGHNGLTAAAYLGRAGLRVALFERRPLVGGFSVTEEIFPGYRISRAAYSAGLLRPEVIAELRLKEFGYEAHAFEPQTFLPLPYGRHIFLWTDMDRTLGEISRFSKKDAATYPRYVQFWTDVMELVEATVLTPPPALQDFLGMFQGPDAEDLMRGLLFRSAADILDEYFESEEVKASMVTGATIGLPAGPRTPGTALMLGHMLLHEINGAKMTFGWARGGMGGISEALSRAAHHFGVEIHTGAAVRTILLRGGRAAGVELQDGTRHEAPTVVSNLDPKFTFLGMVGEDHLEADFRRSLERIHATGVVTKVNCALSEPPSFTCLPSQGLAPQHHGYMDICPSVDYLERAWDDSKYGRPSTEPFLDCVMHSVLDPSMAPPGKYTLSIFSQYMPSRLTKGTWEDRREEVGDLIVDTLAAYAPNVKRAVVHREVLTPLDLERVFGSPGGCIYQIDMTPDQLFSFRPTPRLSGYRGPIPGLYLCGSAMHPGGGVTGAPGRIAAQVALEDRGKGLHPA